MAVLHARLGHRPPVASSRIMSLHQGSLAAYRRQAGPADRCVH
jgi:hypothetical protein